jgi:hypothetical protein
VHTEEFVDSFLTGALDAARLKRIGFGDVSCSPVLIERTLAEVAGASYFGWVHFSSISAAACLRPKALMAPDPHLHPNPSSRFHPDSPLGALRRHSVLSLAACGSHAKWPFHQSDGEPVPCTGTLLTARLALQTGLACNTAGGTHHAFPDGGSGFCILNDLAVTAEVLLRERLVARVLILDLDVHQV